MLVCSTYGVTNGSANGRGDAESGEVEIVLCFEIEPAHVHHLVKARQHRLPELGKLDNRRERARDGFGFGLCAEFCFGLVQKHLIDMQVFPIRPGATGGCELRDHWTGA